MKRKLNALKTHKNYPGRLLKVLCIFSLRLAYCKRSHNLQFSIIMLFKKFEYLQTLM